MNPFKHPRTTFGVGFLLTLINFVTTPSSLANKSAFESLREASEQKIPNGATFTAQCSFRQQTAFNCNLNAGGNMFVGRPNAVFIENEGEMIVLTRAISGNTMSFTTCDAYQFRDQEITLNQCGNWIGFNVFEELVTTGKRLLLLSNGTIIAFADCEIKNQLGDEDQRPLRLFATLECIPGATGDTYIVITQNEASFAVFDDEAKEVDDAFSVILLSARSARVDDKGNEQSIVADHAWAEAAFARSNSSLDDSAGQFLIGQFDRKLYKIHHEHFSPLP
jgi:hypothetical protein